MALLPPEVEEEGKEYVSIDDDDGLCPPEKEA